MDPSERSLQLGNPTSGVEMNQEAENSTAPQGSPILRTERDQWKSLLELQHRNFMELMKTALEPQKKERHFVLPEFNPDDPDADAQAWCNTVDICMKENLSSGSQLVIILSRALKGSAATWLAHNTHAEVTWSELKPLFLSRFHTTETPAAAFFNILSSNPKEGENMSAFVSRILNTLTTSWQNMTTEQIAMSVALGHVARLDSQIQRIAFTTEIKTRVQLQRELMPFVYKKRNLPPSEKVNQAPDAKKPRLEYPRRCYSCGKIGHIASDCRGKDRSNSNQVNSLQPTSSNNPPQRKEPRTITCFRCGEPGHLAPHCTQKKKPENNEESLPERRVNICAIKPASDCLYNLDDEAKETHEDV